MSDNEIRQILRERKKQERALQRSREIKANIDCALCWGSWAALGFMMFLGAYMVG